MLRKYIPFVGFFFVALTSFVWSENNFAPSFKSCISQESIKQISNSPEYKLQFIVIAIKTQSICSLRLIDTHAGFFAMVAAFIVSGFTFTLWQATGKIVEGLTCH